MSFRPGTTIHETPPRPFVACAFMPCGFEAVVRVKNMNLCATHYVAVGQKDANEHARKHDLKTPADHRAYIRKLLNSPRDYKAWMVEPKSALAAEYAAQVRGQVEVADRIPGEDDDLEMAA